MKRYPGDIIKLKNGLTATVLDDAGRGDYVFVRIYINGFYDPHRRVPVEEIAAVFTKIIPGRE